MPSFGGFIVEVARRFRRVCLGYGVSSVLRILCIAILQSIPLTVRRQSPFWDEQLRRTVAHLCRDTIIHVDGIKYALLDYESFVIISHKETEKYESFMPMWLRPKRGEVLLDIGAHIGKYTLTTARTIGDEGLVVAVEPHPGNYQTLMKNIRLNEIENVIALNLAAWDTDCELRVFVGNVSGHHSVKIDQKLGWIKVKARAMDNVVKELRLDRVDWIKIDVERSECEVVDGLVHTINRCRPSIAIEVSHENLPRVRIFMKKHEYGLGISPLLKENLYLFCVPLPVDQVGN